VSAGKLLVPADGATVTTWPDVLVSGSVAAGWFVAVTADDAPPQLARLVPDEYATDGTSWWDAVLQLSPGPHAVRAVAFTPQGDAVSLGTRSIDVHMEPVYAVIDSPAPGDQVAGALRVGGWAAGRDSPIRSITVLVNGRDAGRAHLALHRPDLPAEIALSGFEVAVALDDVAAGEAVSIELDILTVGGDRRRFGPVTATATAAAGDEVERRKPPRARGDLLVVTHDLGYGGGQLWLDVLVRGLADRGRAPTVLAPVDGPLRAELEGRGITVEVTGDHGYSSPVEYGTRADEITEWTRARGFRSVLANTAGAAIGVDVANRLGIPAAWALHESFPLPVFAGIMSRDAAFAAQLLRRSLDTAAAVVFEAEATRRLWLRYCDDPVDAGARFHIVDYGIDVERVERSRAAHTRATARRHIGIAGGDDVALLLCIATVEPRKAQALLVQAFLGGGAASEFPRAQLVLVGDNGGPYSDGVRRLIAGSDLGHRVHLHATTPDIDPWYLAADAFVLPSSVESMPRTLLEAAAFELPAVASAVFGVPEVFEDEHSAVLVEHSDAVSLAGGLRRMLRMSPGDRRRMGAAALAATKHRLDPAGYVDAFEKLLSP